jgi:hypothetical protein
MEQTPMSPEELRKLSPMQDLLRFCVKMDEKELSSVPINKAYQQGFDNAKDNIKSYIEQSYLKREEQYAQAKVLEALEKVNIFLQKVVEEIEVGDLSWQTRDEAKQLL